jgi:hypothetical protein
MCSGATRLYYSSSPAFPVQVISIEELEMSLKAVKPMLTVLDLVAAVRFYCERPLKPRRDPSMALESPSIISFFCRGLTASPAPSQRD